MNSYDSKGANTERPNIAEKVRFWEEQDKINQALIPRVKELHEIVTDLHKRTSNISSQIAEAEAPCSKRYRNEPAKDAKPNTKDAGTEKRQVGQEQDSGGCLSYRAGSVCSRVGPQHLPVVCIAMQSIQLLDELEQAPLRGEHGRYTLSGLMRNDLFAIEVAAGVEDSCSALFDARNVPDDLFEAYRLASPGVAADHSLHERYLEMVERGPESVEGFISNLKGKLGELRVQEHLQQEFPGV